MKPEVISNVLTITFLVAFLVNGLISARANDSRFLHMPKTQIGRLSQRVWLVASMAAALGQLLGKVPAVLLHLIMVGGLTIHLAGEILCKLQTIQQERPGSDPNV